MVGKGPSCFRVISESSSGQEEEEKAWGWEHCDTKQDTSFLSFSFIMYKMGVVLPHRAVVKIHERALQSLTPNTTFLLLGSTFMHVFDSLWCNINYILPAKLTGDYL